ncbi:MAG: amidohydrolase family protein [Chloroflexi bacterium]|nr:amidohydrolase family protein [Chloroflexota bacterium]
MLIVDSHAHLIDRDWAPAGYWETNAWIVSRRLGVSLEEAHLKVAEMWDGTGDPLVATLDRAGVSHGLVLNVDWGLAQGQKDSPLPIEEIHHRCYQVVQHHAGRLSWAVGVDPRRPQSALMVHKAVTEYGARAVKFRPDAGFYPNDPVAYPIYRECLELGIPVVFHCGPILPPLRSKYTEPIYLDDVCKDFPELTVVAAHLGHGYWQQTLSLAKSNPNIVCDLAHWDWYVGSQPRRFYETVRYIMDVIGSQRMMFGTDAIGGRDQAAYLRWVRAFTEIPPEIELAGIRFSQGELADFLGATAARIFQLGTPT